MTILKGHYVVGHPRRRTRLGGISVVTTKKVVVHVIGDIELDSMLVSGVHVKGHWSRRPWSRGWGHHPWFWLFASRLRLTEPLAEILV
jgi:tetrahydromethanopterin S-methyltransferase subunit A